MRRIIQMAVLLALLLGSTLPGVTAQEVSPDASPASEGSLLADLGYPVLEVTTDGTEHDLPDEIEAGRYHVILHNEGEMNIDLEFYQLPEGMTFEEVDAEFQNALEGPEFVPPDVFYELVFNGGASSEPGGSGEAVVELTPGQWEVNLFSYSPDSDEEMDNFHTLNVTGEMPELDEVPGAIEIGMAEMYFDVPESLESGPQIWKGVNYGEQVHHIAVDRVPDGTTVEEVQELVDAEFAALMASPEAAATPAETGLSFEDFQPVFASLPVSGGQANWYALDLKPGTYTLWCFMPDPTGKLHVMLGMIEIIVVE